MASRAQSRLRLFQVLESVSRPSRPLLCRRCYSTRQSSPIVALLSRPRLPDAPSPSGCRTLFSGVVVKNYVDLPPDYDDGAGLAFAPRDLGEREVAAVFGPGMRPSAANKLLRILHGRRVAGTLDDPAVQINTVPFEPRQQKAALAYLRSRVPVDEVANAGLRAEDELRALEGEPGSAEENKTEEKKPGYSSRFQIYKKAEAEETARAARDKIYGQSVLDRIRARNEARWKEELQRREEEEAKRAEEEAQWQPGPLQKMDDSPPRQLSARMQKWTEAASSDLQEPPSMRAWQRLLPSTIAVGLVVGGLVAYVEWYTPPAAEQRLWPEIPPAAATVLGLVGLNVAAFVCWRLPPLWRVLNRYLIVVPATPRALSLVGAVFSHQMAGHLAVNMLFLWFFGTRLHDEAGRAGFLATYLAAGTGGFLASLYTLVLRGQLQRTTLGASGAIYGVAAAYFWMHRFDGFKIFGLPPEPWNGVQGLGFIGLMVALNISAMFSKSHVLDIGSHLGGLGLGIIAGELLQRRQRRQTEAETETDKTEMGVVDKILEKKQ